MPRSPRPWPAGTSSSRRRSARRARWSSRRGCFLAFFALSFVPFLSLLGQLGVLVLLAWVPVLFLRWYPPLRQARLPGDEYRQARDWVQQAVVIWGLALFATPDSVFHRVWGAVTRSPSLTGLLRRCRKYKLLYRQSLACCRR